MGCRRGSRRASSITYSAGEKVGRDVVRVGAKQADVVKYTPYIVALATLKPPPEHSTTHFPPTNQCTKNTLASTSGARVGQSEASEIHRRCLEIGRDCTPQREKNAIKTPFKYLFGQRSMADNLAAVALPAPGDSVCMVCQVQQGRVRAVESYKQKNRT